jgi:hypothetical protein
VKGPVLIVGTMRSGSTLLRLMLDRHERLSIGPESGFMGLARAAHDIPGWSRGHAWYERYGATREQVDAHVRALIEDVLGGQAAAHGAARWGDKTPFHVWHLEDMVRLFPDAALVGIVRHPGATLVSTRRWRYTPEDAISKWVRANAEIVRRAHAFGPGRMRVIRYEDLVLSPRPTLTSLLELLEEPWSDRMLQEQRSASEIVEGGTRADAPLDPGRIDAWTREITRRERRLMATRVPTGLLDALGYDLSRPRPVSGAPGALDLADVDLSGVPDGGKRAAGAFDPEREALLHLDREELVHRLLKSERRRTASRRRVLRVAGDRARTLLRGAAPVARGPR